MFRQSNPKRSQTNAASVATVDSSASNTTAEAASVVKTLAPKPLGGCLISYTGLSATERSQVNKLVKTLGGETNVDLTDDVTYLIATKAMTAKYKIAFSLMIPVIEPDWLKEIHQQWTTGQPVDLKAITSRHALGPFRGCTICVTGFIHEVRAEIENYTVQYGGTFTSDMLRGKTTHLICDVAKGTKYETAHGWGIKRVSYEWFVECMRTLELVDETKYPAPTEEQKKQAQTGAEPLSNSIMDARASRIPDYTYLETCHIYLCPTFDEEALIRLKTLIRMGGGVQVTEYNPKEVTHVIVPGMAIDDNTMTLFQDGSDLPCIVNAQWLKVCCREHKRVPESQYVVPFSTRSETTHSKNHHLHGPQTWTTDPIVIGSSRQARPRLEDTRASNVATIRGRGSAPGGGSGNGQATSERRKSGGSSTFQNHREQPPLSPPTSPSTPTSSHSHSSSPTLTRRMLMNRTMSGLLAQDVADLSINHTSRNESLTLVEKMTDGPTLEENTHHNSKHPLSVTPILSSTSHTNKTKSSESSLSSTCPKDDSDSEIDQPRNKLLFATLSFTTFGCTEETVETVRSATVEHGGRFFKEGTVPKNEQEIVHTIVPRHMPRANTTHLKGFVLTTGWLEKCVMDGHLAPKKGFLFCPLEHVPIEGFSDLNISLSTTLDEVDFILLAKLVKILGATYHENVLKSSTNLLISDVAQGPKFEFMWKNNRPVVTCEWLKQSVAQGRPLPYDQFLVTPRYQPSATPPAVVYRTPSGEITSPQWQQPSLTQQRSDSSSLPSNTAAKSEPTDTPLAGLVLCVTQKALSDTPDLITIIQELGGQAVRQYNHSITHVVHKATKTRDAFKDLKRAKMEHKFVVAPQWVLQCQKERRLVDEREFPETYDPKRRTLQMTLPPPAPPTRSKTLPSATTTRPMLRSTSNSAQASLGNNGNSINANNGHGTFNNTSRFMSLEPSQALSQYIESPSGYYASPSLELPTYDSMTQDHSMYYEPLQPSLSLSVDPGNGTKIRRGRKRERPSESSLVSQAPVPSEPSSSTPSYTTRVQMPVDEGIDYSDDEGRAFRRKHMRRVDTTGWVSREEEERQRQQEDNNGTAPGTTDVSMQEDTLSVSTNVGGGGAFTTGATDAGTNPTTASERKPRQPYQFLLTAIRYDERDNLKTAIRRLGGSVLEDETQSVAIWKQECTHLLTQGRNPQRTAKLLMARATPGIHVVYRNYILDSLRAGKFLDETDYLV